MQPHIYRKKVTIAPKGDQLFIAIGIKKRTNDHEVGRIFIAKDESCYMTLKVVTCL